MCGKPDLKHPSGDFPSTSWDGRTRDASSTVTNTRFMVRKGNAAEMMGWWLTMTETDGGAVASVDIGRNRDRMVDEG